MPAFSLSLRVAIVSRIKVEKYVFELHMKPLLWRQEPTLIKGSAFGTLWVTLLCLKDHSSGLVEII